MNITAKELSGMHLGESMSVTIGDSSVLGIFAGINQQHDKVHDPTWVEPNNWVLGELSMQLTILLETGFIEVNVTSSTPIVIQEQK